MNLVQLRPATRHDLPDLEHVEREAAQRFPADVLPPQLAAPLPAETLAACLEVSLLWVAEEGRRGSPAGRPHGIVGFLAAERHGDTIHLIEMDVLPSHGQRGLGGRLLQQLSQVARERGCRTITLTTFAHLPWNAPFYAKHGFREVDAFDGLAHLEEALARERASGLERRVAMVWDVGLQNR